MGRQGAAVSLSASLNFVFILFPLQQSLAMAKKNCATSKWWEERKRIIHKIGRIFYFATRMVLCQQTQRESAMSIMKLFPRDEIGRAVSDEMAFAQNVRGAICLALVSDICQPSPTKELKKSGSQVQWKLRKLKHKSFYLGITNCELTGFVLVKKGDWRFSPQIGSNCWGNSICDSDFRFKKWR